jgi:hypothetical protein
MAAPLRPGRPLRAWKRSPDRRRHAGGSDRDRAPLRGETCSLFFTDSTQTQSRHWCDVAVCGRSAGRAPAGFAAVTDPDPGNGSRSPGGRSGPLPPGPAGGDGPERVLFEAFDEVLKRRVSLRVNPQTDEASRAWFMREAEALGQLDHPAVGHVYRPVSSATSPTGSATGSMAKGCWRRSAGAPPHPDRPRDGARPPQRAGGTPICTGSSCAGSRRCRCW